MNDNSGNGHDTSEPQEVSYGNPGGAPEVPEPPRTPQSSFGSRAVVIGFGLLLVAGIIGFLIEQSREIYATVRPVQHLAKHLVKSGFNASGPSKAPDGIIQTSGTVYSIDVDGKPIYIVTFDGRDPKQRDELRDVRKSRGVVFSGNPRPAIINGDLVIAGFDGRDDEEKLVDALQKFREEDDSK